jgi:membrane protein DedA with SNARE-associated domain
MNVVGVVAAATLGSVVGAIVLYWIGYTFNVEVIERFIGRWGYLLRLKVEDIEKADHWFEKRGILTVFLCRMIPVLRSLISIPAGMSEMKFRTFLVFTILGTLIWNIILVSAGVLLGANWRNILSVLSAYQSVTFAVLAILFVIMVIWLVRKNKNKVNA